MSPDQSVQIKRDMMLTRLAHRLGVREELIRSRLMELRSQHRDAGATSPDRRPGASEKKASPPPPPPHERELLELLLGTPALVPAAVKAIGLHEITHADVRQLVEGLYNLQHEGEVPDLDALRPRLGNPALAALAMDLCDKGRRCTEDREAWLRKIVAVFQNLRNVEAKQELKSQLTNAPDLETELELLRRLQDQSGKPGS